jgi:hypothetical protein
MNHQIEPKESGKSEIEIKELFKMKPFDEVDGRTQRLKQQDSATDQDDPPNHGHYHSRYASRPALMSQHDGESGSITNHTEPDALVGALSPSLPFGVSQRASTARL